MIIFVSAIVSLLLLAGCMLVLGFDPRGALAALKKQKTDRPRNPVRQRHITLKKRLEELRGLKKVNFLSRSIADAQQVLAKTGRAEKVKSTMTLCTACGAGGFMLSLAAKNLLLCPILTIGFYLVPLWIVKITAKNYKKRLNNELSTCLSVITASYVRNENLMVAVEENLVNLHAPVKEPFALFLTQVKFINSDVVSALKTLQNSIDNAIFRSWCASLIQCQNDRSLKYTLQPLVNKFSQTKAIQAELETDLMKPLSSFLQMAGLVVICIPGLYVLNKEWFFYLTGTFWGQLSIAVTAVLIMKGVNKAINLSQPIEPKY